MLVFFFVYACVFARIISVDLEVVYTEVRIGDISINLLNDRSNATRDNHPLSPTIYCHEGNTLNISVTNNLPYEFTTIHLHGIHMLNTPYMDGVPYVTQMPIAPKDTMVYTFLANKAGTMWYHSHIELQRNILCFGALIVQETDPENEIVLVLSDVYNQDEHFRSS